MEDVTGRKVAEASLRESELRFREFGEASSDILWVRNSATLQWEYLSPAFEAIYGLPIAGALEGDNWKNWQDLILDEDRERALQCVDRVRSGERVVFDYRIRRPDGQIRWLRDTDFPIFSQDGKVERFAGIGQDITGIKRFEQALRDSEARYRLIVENARDYAIFTTDPDLVVTDWHEGAEAVFGYSPDEIIGHDGRILFTEEDRSNGEPEKERRIAAETGSAPNVRWHLRKDGSRVFIDGVSTSLRDDEGNLTGFLKIGQDVTERRKAEEEIRESERRAQLLLAELQHRVRNLLAMIRSVARRTAEGSIDVDHYAQHLEGRLSALGRVQTMLTRKPGRGINLRNLLLDEIEAHVAEDGRVKLDGPEVELSPKAAEVFTLAIHELLTNSTKYGSLGDGGAPVRLHWNLDTRDGREWLNFAWREQLSSPARRAARDGFGTELITQRVPYELRGTGEIRIEESAVKADIAFPLTDGQSILATAASEEIFQ